jgi:hypothetical protein
MQNENVLLNMMMVLCVAVNMHLKMANENTIHSGHFMVSSLNDEDETELPASSVAVKNETEDAGRHGYNFDNANLQLSQTYLFGSRSTNMLALDPSLTKMFECMTLAYRLVWLIILVTVYLRFKSIDILQHAYSSSWHRKIMISIIK